MPRPRNLSAVEARRTLAHRLAPRVDRLRQFATKFGIRPYRVFLVWTLWSGIERGEGTERVVKRIELLPTPKVTDLTAVATSPFSAGTLPLGSIRVEEISAFTYTQDVLVGKAYPDGHEDAIPEDVSFEYEVVEDGRGDPQPVRAKYRVSTTPYRAAGRVQWMVLLERVSEDNNRDGTSAAGG